MALQERFDEIIDSIEYHVATGELDIPQTVALESGYNLRLLGDAFQFIADITLIKYIRQRRLIHALTKKVKQNLSVEDIAADTQFSDAAAFTKACKNEFNLTPSQITEEFLEEYPPLHFNRVLSGKNADTMESDTLIATSLNNRSVSVKQFAEIKRALEISAIYGFTDEESEFVYRFAAEFEMTVDEAAEVCEEMRIEEKYDLYPSEMQQALYEIKRNGYSRLYELPDGFWDVFLSNENNRHGWFVPYICEIAEALDAHGLCAADLEQIALHADTYGIDIVEAIENFDKYEKSWDDMVYDAMTKGIPEDATSGFGYRSIWEFDEEDLGINDSQEDMYEEDY